MSVRSTALRMASVVACGAGLSGCLAVLDSPIFIESHDASAPRDAFASDARDGSIDVATDTVHDATVDAPRADAPTIDAVVQADHAIDAPTMRDMTLTGETSSGDATAGFVGPAAVNCSVAMASPPIATYEGTTCDGMDLANLSCNGSGHSEVVIRIDGLPGQIWDITPSGGLAYALHLGTNCGIAPVVCGAGTRDGGGSISDGPFPAARTDYIVVETVSPTPCGPYSITVMLR